MFPADNVWHSSVAELPVHPKSAQYVASISTTAGVHADFGSGTWNGGPIGIPYDVVGAGQPTTSVSFTWPSESDQVPYPIPANPSIEGGPSSTGDRHVLIVDNSTCKLYELYAAYPNGNGTWRAGSGAVWDLNSNALRPDTWTSADAAGLPILPGLVRYDEVAAGRIDHAIRVTVPASDRSYLWPAKHQAGTANPNLPPMGLRLRLKASFDISGFPRDDQVILQAMKTYGVIVADNGSPWYISGAPDARWDNDVLHQLGAVKGSDFEAVDASGLMIDASSGASRGTSPPAPAPLPLGDGPGTTVPASGVEDVYIHGLDDALWTRRLVNGGWTPWKSLGGIVTSAPAASGLDIYVRGRDGALWTRRADTAWTSLGGFIVGAPAATSTDVFVRGGDNALWTRHLNAGTWGPWVSLGGHVTSAPAASASDVFARGTDNAIWTRRLAGASWGPWVSLGGSATSAPSAAAGSVYVRGIDNALWSKPLTGTWSTLGGLITSPPAANGVSVYARGLDNALWRRTSSGWSSLGGGLR